MKEMRIVTLAGLVLVLGPAGCRDLGLPGNVPEEQSRTQPPPALVRAVTSPADDAPVRLVVDGRLWVPTGLPAPHTAGSLRPVGSAAGRTVYARAWDDRPYRAIFTAVELPAVEAAATPAEAMRAGRQYWQEYAPVLGQSGRVTGADRLRRDLIREAPPATID